MATQNLLVATSLCKNFGGVVALDHMSLAVEPGTIHAVVGENGAGKSTLMKILAGALRPDKGTIAFNGSLATIPSPRAAKALGIAMFYQELSIFPHRSILANLYPNREPARFGFVSLRTMRERSAAILEELGLAVDVNENAGTLTVGERQLVELSRVMLEDPTLLILDEPNSALNEQETQRLFTILRRLRERGMTLLYVSHRLQEVFAIADRITVCRNGQDVFTQDRSALTMAEVIEGMIGGRQEELYPPPLPSRQTGPRRRVALSGLTAGRLQGVSLEARSGEIVGLAGLEGSGVSDLLLTLFGGLRAKSGAVSFPDGRGLPRSPTEAARRNICLVPADRKRLGLMLDKSLVDNIGHVTIGTLAQRVPWLRRADMLDAATRQIQSLRIMTRSPLARASQLSGGNQQKVVIGKWLEAAPAIVLLDDPTRGVDIGAKHEIYLIIRDLAAEGRVVLFSSTDTSELVGLCDRIFAFYHGCIVGEQSGAAVNERDLLHLINTGEGSGEPELQPAHIIG